MIERVTSKSGLAAVMGRTNYGFGASVIGLDISEDIMSSSRNAVYIDQDGLGLPHRDYYL